MTDTDTTSNNTMVNQLILDTLAEGVLACDNTGRIIALNPAMLSIIYNNEDASTMRSVDLGTIDMQKLAMHFTVTELDRSPVPLTRMPLTRALTGERFQNVELYLQPKGEQPKRLSISGAPLLDPQGYQVGAVNVTQDITQSHERAREASIAQAMLDATTDSAFRIDPDTLGFLYANQALIKLLDTGNEDLSNHHLLEFIPEAEHRELLENLEALQSGTHAIEVLELSLVTSSGNQVAVEASLQFLPAIEGKPMIIGVLRDISERQRMQRQKMANQRMEAIGSLASGMAHDLNNVLTPVMLGIQMLRESPEKPEEWLQSIEASTARGVEMIKRLLAFARGEEQSEVFCNTESVMEEMVHIVESTFPKNIRLDVDIEDGLPETRINSTRLHQMLLNLCVNARDAMKEGGCLSLRAQQRVEAQALSRVVGNTAPGRYVEFSVEDTGTGIADCDIDKIFDEFFTTRTLGSGIGLNTVKEIIEASGGFLEINTTDSGTCFRVGIPIVEPGAAELKSGTQKRDGKIDDLDPAAPNTILLVDDEAMIRTMVATILRNQGFEVLTAIDGAQGLEIARENQAKILAVISDTSMPGMGGLTFITHLADEYPNLPVIVCSGNLSAELRKAFEDKGVRRFLFKPFRRDDLIDAIEYVGQGVNEVRAN